MNIKEIVQKLQEIEFEGRDDVVPEIEKLYHKLTNEAATHRKQKEQLEQRIREAAEIGDDTKLEEALEGIGKKSNSSKTLEQQFAKLQKDFSQLLNEKKALETKDKESARDIAIAKALTKAGVRSEALDGVRKMLAVQAVIDEAGDWVLGEDSLEEGAVRYVKDNPWLVDAQQKPGSGSQAPKGAAKKQYFTQADVNNMTPAERKQNMAAILASREQAAKDGKDW